MPFTNAIAAPENCYVNYDSYLSAIGHTDFIGSDDYYIFFNFKYNDIWTSACVRIPEENTYTITLENKGFNISVLKGM
jgi:hypothetical protein